MISQILDRFATYLVTSAGFNDVSYGSIDISKIGATMKLPSANIESMNSNYPNLLSPGAIISTPIRLTYIFKSTKDEGTIEAFTEATSAEMNLVSLFYNVPFRDYLKGNPQTFITFDDISASTFRDSNLIGTNNPVFRCEVIFTIRWYWK